MDFLWDKITEWLKEMLIGGIAVSYTHLDVYKRQLNDLYPPGTLCNCVLYILPFGRLF